MKSFLPEGVGHTPKNILKIDYLTILVIESPYQKSKEQSIQFLEKKKLTAFDMRHTLSFKGWRNPKILKRRENSPGM